FRDPSRARQDFQSLPARSKLLPQHEQHPDKAAVDTLHLGQIDRNALLRAQRLAQAVHRLARMFNRRIPAKADDKPFAIPFMLNRQTAPTAAGAAALPKEAYGERQGMRQSEISQTKTVAPVAPPEI